MTLRSLVRALVVPATAGLTLPAAATLTLNSGDAVFSSTVPTTATATAMGLGNFQPDGTTDHLMRITWHWRINGVDTREFVFSSAAGFSFTEAGSGTPVGTQSWTGLDGGRFDALLTSTLTDGGSPGQAILVQSMAITNVSGGALDMALFSFADFDVSGGGAGDSATLFSSDTIQVTDDADVVYHQGIGAANHAVDNTLYAALTNGTITNFANTGLPFGPGDYSGGWQWNDNAIANGATVTLTAAYAINMSVPSPGALALVVVGGLVTRRRRRA